MNWEPKHEPGCLHNIRWRLDLSPHTNVPYLIERLADSGFTPIRHIPNTLYMFQDPQGGTLVLVAKTLRIQIRVDYAIPHDLRPQAARIVAALLKELATHTSGAHPKP